MFAAVHNSPRSSWQEAPQSYSRYSQHGIRYSAPQEFNINNRLSGIVSLLDCFFMQIIYNIILNSRLGFHSGILILVIFRHFTTTRSTTARLCVYQYEVCPLILISVFVQHNSSKNRYLYSGVRGGLFKTVWHQNVY